MEYLFYYMPTTSNKIWEVKTNKTPNFGQNAKFFCKNGTTTYITITASKSFYIIFADIISEILRF